MNYNFFNKLLNLLLFLAAGSIAYGQNPPPSQLYYVPFPEDKQLEAFQAITSVAVEPISVFVTIAAASNDTVIYYDHWEDGYERDLTNPRQSTTLIFGDGNQANGFPPGNPTDRIPAGTVFNLRNFVTTSTLGSVVDFDAGDKIASFKPITVTKTTFPGGTNTLLAGCVEMFENGLWGTEYRSPVGVDMPVSTASSTLAYDENLFEYTALSISAGPGGASVQIDKDNNGVFEETVVLTEGQSVYRSGVNVGGRVLATRPVQVILFTGTPGSTYASRDSSLLPSFRWGTEYYSPVSTRTTPKDGAVVFLHNPNASAITVSYDYRSSNTTYVTSTVAVPAGGNARVLLQPAGTNHFGAYKFYTTGANPPVFNAIGTIDADDLTGNSGAANNNGWDGGFTLVTRSSLTTQVQVSLGIGRDPYSTTNPTENGNPVWITTSGNGNTPSTVYVDYNGDLAGPLVDPNGNRYDVAYSLRELQQQKLFDPDGDQSGMLVYTLDTGVRIAAVWAQDPTVASFGQPGLDVASLVPPMREGAAGKKSNLYLDADGDGFVSAGDTIEYDIRAASNARANIPGPFRVRDTLPTDITYVPGTVRYRFTVGGVWQTWTSVPDDGSGTAFPMDGAGFSVPGNLPSGQQMQVTFRAVIDSYANLSGPSITNTGDVEISPYGLLIPITWTDLIYGSIGDRVWTDTNGNGAQNDGELGIPNIRVYADLNGNGSYDTDEPNSITDSSGNYLIPGLLADTYTIRVDSAAISAIDPGYGPTFDLDGIDTSHVSTVTLAAAEQRTDADFGYRIGASVGDRVWIDLDGDGVQEDGEPGINGVRVYVDLDNSGDYNSGEPNTFTSGDGDYYIGNLNTGTYQIRVDTTTLPSGATQTFDANGALDHRAQVAFVGSEHVPTLDFGYRGALSIGDLVWEDLNADGNSGGSIVYNINNGRIDLNGDDSYNNSDDGFIGTMRIINGYVDIDDDSSTPVDNGDDGTFLGVNIVNGGFDMNGSGGISTSGSNDDGTVTYNSSEAAIPNVLVYIDSNGNGSHDANEASAVTDSNGAYTIGNLFDGTYIVRVDPSTLPSASYVATYDLTSPIGDDTATVTLSGSSRTDVDFGYRNDATLGDLVWNDRDSDGVRDDGEPGIPGVVVFIDLDNDGFYDFPTEVSATTDVDGYYIIENLPAGSFNVRVDLSTLPAGAVQTYDLDGTGSANSASRSLAQSENATDVDFGYRTTASVGDFVWRDTNGNGLQDDGATGISGVRVYLDTNGNGLFEPASEPSDVTDGSGAYEIDNLLPGAYTARIDTSTLSATDVQTYDLNGGLDNAATFTLSANQERTDIDFGYTTRVSIGDLVWNDANGNGQKDASESGLPGVGITVVNASNSTIQGTTVSGANGEYSFTDLLPGTYYLIFDELSGYERTSADQGNDTSDSDPNVTTGRTGDITLTAGQANLTIDAGYYQPGAISGTVLADIDNDDNGDNPISGVTLTLKDSSGNDIDSDPNTSGVQPTTTDTLANGTYSFTNLPPGSYRVVQTQPSTYISVSDVDGANDNIIGEENPIVLTGGQTISGQDFVEEQPGSISGTVLADIDNNDTGDNPISDVTLTLKDSSGNDIDSDPNTSGVQPTTTDTLADGTYSFANVPPGSYRVVQTQPSSYLSVSDVDGANDNIIGEETPIVITPGLSVTGRNFVEELPGTIAGTVLEDTDNNDTGDDPIPSVTLTLKDSSGNDIDSDPNTSGVQPTTTDTIANGSYIFENVPPGSYRVVQSQPSGFISVSDVDGLNNNAIGDETPILLSAGQAITGRDFIEEEPGSISGTVRADIDNNDTGDDPISGVTLTLKDSSGDDIDSDPNTSGVQPTTTQTLANGTYSFTNLPPDDYQVVETDLPNYQSVTTNTITAVTVNPGANTGGIDYVDEELGAITGFVYVGTDPLSSVTLTLLDSSGDPVDGDPNTSGVQPITTTTLADGSYSFNGVPPGSYQVGQTQPFGYESVSDRDGGDINIIGDNALVVVTAGETNAANNFVEALDTCPDNWAEWKFQHPGEVASGNPDLDGHDNLTEFAFAMPAESGAGDAWRIQPSVGTPGELDGVFTRPTGAPDNVVYTLQYASTIADPTVWVDIIITPAMYTVVNNGDCTETLTITDLETLTGLTGGKGVVRIKADLDEENDNNVDHTSYTEVEGWKVTDFGICCQTYATPYLRDTVFTGTVDASGVNGQVISFSGSTDSDDLATLLVGGTYFLEVTSGTQEGHRFDIVSASGSDITVANDVSLSANTAPFNTVTGAPPSSLEGSSVVIRRHWTVDEMFPPSGFVATGDQATADQLQINFAGVWTILHLYDDGGTPRWVDNFNDQVSQGGTIIPPGHGLFFNNRNSAKSLLTYGEVRENDFMRPLVSGYNFVSGGYPTSQSATGTGSRTMSLTEGFFGSRDFKTADSFFLWKGDATPGISTYDTYYMLMNGSAPTPSLLRWVKVGDSLASPRDAEILLLENRAVFTRSATGLSTYGYPSPWSP